MKYFTILLSVLVLFSCTKEVKIDIPGYKEQLVIDGSIEPGSPAIVLLSKTSNIYSPTNLEAYLNGFISGATIVISDGTVTDTLIEICTDNLPPGTEEQAAAFFGLPIDQIVNLHLCAYISTNIIGQVGKTYSLKVINDGKTYTSQTSILPPTALDSVYWKPEPSNPLYGFSWARLSDPGATTDAYAWQTKYISDTNFQPLIGNMLKTNSLNGNHLVQT
jgi:hypothetical protein